MYRTGSLVCAACLWPRLVFAGYFEPSLNRLKVCSRGVCADEILLSLSMTSGTMNDGKEYSVEFPSVADTDGVVWTFVAPWTVTWTSLVTESIHKATFKKKVKGQEEIRTRIDKDRVCPWCPQNNKNSNGFCCSFGDLRAAGTADVNTTKSHHCLISSDWWDIYQLEHDHTRYTFRVHISRPRLNSEGFLDTVETTWHIDSDGAELAVTVPERDDTSSLDYLSHREVVEMVAPGFSSTHFLRKTSTSLESEFLFRGMLLPVEFVDWSGNTCKTGVAKEGFNLEANYCDRDADFCNGKQVNVLYDRDVVLAGTGGQPLYLIEEFCEGNATSFQVEDSVYIITCPFTVDTYTEVSIKFPVYEKDFELSLVTEVTGQCSDMCPDLYDVACLVNHECWQTIGIMMLSLTFFCAGVCFVCCIVAKKRTALKQHVSSMRKSKADPDVLTSSTHGGSLGSSSWGLKPEMISQCGAPTLSSLSQPVMSLYGVPQMQVQCSQYGAPIQSAPQSQRSQYGAAMYVQ